MIRDGVELPEEQARALWRAFSEHMDRNQQDMDGFARDHGFATVRAEHRRGRAMLVVASLASRPPASRPPTSRRSTPPAPAVRATRPTAMRAGEKKR